MLIQLQFVFNLLAEPQMQMRIIKATITDFFFPLLPKSKRVSSLIRC